MLIADIGADALLDLDLQFEWYADVADEDVAERYLSAFHETKEQLCLQPDLGRIRRFRDRRLSKLRSFHLRGSFQKHLIFYRVENDTLVVFRVLQGMRDLPRRLLEPPGSE
jgi:plasmid stabilization system protein ParE